MVAVVPVGSSTKDNVPRPVIGNVVEGEDAPKEVVIQPPSPDDICAFYDLPANFKWS